MSSNDIVLKVAGVSKRFGGLQALSDVGITIRARIPGAPRPSARLGFRVIPRRPSMIGGRPSKRARLQRRQPPARIGSSIGLR